MQLHLVVRRGSGISTRGAVDWAICGQMWVLAGMWPLFLMPGVTSMVAVGK